MTKALIRIFIKDAQNVQNARVREQYGVLSGAVGIACNLFLFVLKIAIGLLSGAISIAADAFNNLSDGLSCLISIVGFKLAGKEPDEKHPFGHGRTEYIAGLVVSFIIILVGVEFFKTSIGRIFHPTAVALSTTMVVILLVSMAVKLWMGAFNVYIGRCISSTVLMAAGQDSRNDVISTGVVVIGMVAGRFTALPVDGYIGVLVALFIIWSGIGIARDTVDPLLGEAADPQVVENIKKIVLQSEYIVGVHDLIVHNYGAGRSLASIHAEVPSDADFVKVHEVIDEVEKRVRQKTGVYLVVHMDPIEVNNAYVSAIREKVDAILYAIDENLSMHDFRVVDGVRQINLIFDVVVPFSYNAADKRLLIQSIRDRIKEIDARYHPMVTFDHQM